MLAKQLPTQFLYSYTQDFFMYLESDRSEKTKETYKKHLDFFCQTVFLHDLDGMTIKELQSIDTNLMIKYKNHLIQDPKNYANNTISAKLSAVRSFINYMRFRKLTDYDVSADIKYVGNMKKKVKHHDTIPMEAVPKMIQHIRDNEKNLKKQKEWFIKIAVETGLRTNEILSLKRTNFTYHSDNIHVVMKSDLDTLGKGDQEWKELIHIDFYNELRDDFFTDDLKLFTMDESTIRKSIQRIMKKLGYEGQYTNHSLKRRAVNNTMDFTNDPRAAQAKGKHANMSTTFENYIDDVAYGATGYYSMQYQVKEDHIATATHEELLKAIDKLDPNMVLLIQMQLQKMKGE